MKATVVAMGLNDVLGKLKEAQEQAAQHAEQQKANEKKLREAGYGDEAICLLNACMYVVANPDVQGMTHIGHAAKEHDILEAAQAFAAYYRFVDKALGYIRRAEQTAHVELVVDVDDAVKYNHALADDILAKLETKYANQRAVEAQGA